MTQCQTIEPVGEKPSGDSKTVRIWSGGEDQVSGGDDDISSEN